MLTREFAVQLTNTYHETLRQVAVDGGQLPSRTGVILMALRLEHNLLHRSGLHGWFFETVFAQYALTCHLAWLILTWRSFMYEILIDRLCRTGLFAAGTQPSDADPPPGA